MKRKTLFKKISKERISFLFIYHQSIGIDDIAFV